MSASNEILKSDPPCTYCGELVLAYHFKITQGFYGDGLCNKCEHIKIQNGFWTAELIAKNIKDRDLNIHNPISS